MDHEHARRAMAASRRASQRARAVEAWRSGASEASDTSGSVCGWCGQEGAWHVFKDRSTGEDEHLCEECASHALTDTDDDETSV